MTKSLFFLFLVALILASCSSSPPGTSREISLGQESSGSYTATAAAGVYATPTQAPLPVNTVSPTPVQSPTASFTPTPMPTATIDLSFYELAECIPHNTLVQYGTVTQVIDGDTIYVLLDDGLAHSVRYIGVDAPESNLPLSAEASQANSAMVLDKEVILVMDQSVVDQYDRLLRYVIVDQVFVNLEMVKSGFAQAQIYPPDEACADAFASAETVARSAYAGMWVATQPADTSAAQMIILEVNKRDEWVDIQNKGDIEVDLTGWNLVSERGHQECLLSGTLGPGETLRIWSMAAVQGGFSCGYTSPIWNNSESDPAVLYNAQGVEVSRK